MLGLLYYECKQEGNLLGGNKMTEIKKQTFGVEIETVGKNRRDTAQIVADLFNTTKSYEGGCYDMYIVRDSQGRKWSFMRDGSLSSSASCEVVTPVLNYDDIEMLQEVVRTLRANGCKADYSCGIHVHVGTDEVEDFGRYVKNLTNIVETHYDILIRALAVLPSRADRWARKNSDFQNAVNRKSLKDEKAVMKAWYGTDSESSCEYHRNTHYDSSRYHLLNMHSYFQGKGVEFRAFNGTMHAGEIRAYICLCLAMNTYAINAKFTGKKDVDTYNDVFSFRGWLKQLHLVGDEFKNVRFHLLKKLEGNTSSKNGSFTSRRAV